MRMPTMKRLLTILVASASLAAGMALPLHQAQAVEVPAALSIDGNEAAAGRTGPRFADAFRRAGAAGLKRTVHTFEWSDDNVWSVARTSIDASFANDDVKTRLRNALGRW